MSKGSGNGVSVNLADGTTAEADILVGSDGIWSAIRAQMYGEEVKKSSNNSMKRQGCNYSGYTVFAGETVLKTDDYYETGYKVYIGPQRYFVTSDVGDGRVQWYEFFSTFFLLSVRTKIYRWIGMHFLVFHQVLKRLLVCGEVVNELNRLTQRRILLSTSNHYTRDGVMR